MKSAFGKILGIFIMLQTLPACSTISYYAQGAKGHLALMSQRTPVSQAINDDKLSEERKDQIRQVVKIRDFAHQRLKLPKNNSYTSYVELDRKAVSWNLIATPKYSMTPVKSCFPFIGCASYRVYFTPERAQREAKKHQTLGHDTHIIESPAYSTLGIFDDPIISTMFGRSMSSTAEVLFHELAHQRLFRPNDTAFNEAFASAVGQEGTRLWLKEQHPEKLSHYEEHLEKRWQFFNLLLDTSMKLKSFYAEKHPDTEAEKGKQKIFKYLKHQYSELRKSWGGDKRFDNWFNKHPLNNAKLAVIGVYYRKVPEFAKQLKTYNYNFEKFYEHYESKPEETKKTVKKVGGVLSSSIIKTESACHPH